MGCHLAAVAGDPINERRLAAAREIAGQPAVVGRRGRSRVTNGRSLFVEHDGRGPWTRRWRDLYEQIVRELQSRYGSVSEGQRQEARRYATIAIACEKQEGEANAGHNINLNQYGMLTDRLARISRRLGLRQSHDEPKGRTFGQVLVEDYERRQIEDRIREEEKQRAASNDGAMG
jgi:hypothetical protein